MSFSRFDALGDHTGPLGNGSHRLAARPDCRRQLAASPHRADRSCHGRDGCSAPARTMCRSRRPVGSTARATILAAAAISL
jgi:hypothetical protein